ncbi:cell envelope integrity protein TolA [Pantoea sp. Mhis]|uniref:cell envelope integrity protein TolA n=1 Tax=Pantoea sp. Mhis TaxID=2576759 RepID=UPI001359217B|nr:cell envelope integrity protein TolA [Pantoea sp. Mhis]MXP56292.1 cell envelope integrity protein TolA [Pantoea sp. Mhis]
MTTISGQNKKLKEEIIISAMLHIILFTLLIYTSFHEFNKLNLSKKNIDAIMIDSSKIIEQYNLNRYNKSINKQRVKIQDKYIQSTNNQIKYTDYHKLKKGVIQKVETNKKQINQKNHVYKIPQDVSFPIKDNVKQPEITLKLKSLKVSKINPYNKQLSTNSKGDESTVSNLIKNLASEDKILKNNSNNIINTQNQNKILTNKLNTALTTYLEKITNAIQNHFYNANTYHGKSCYLRMRIASNGLLMNIKAERGDKILCQAAILAAEQAHIPAPPSLEIYKFFENIIMIFTPK